MHICRYILQSAFSKIYLLLKENDGDDESSVNGRRFICPWKKRQHVDLQKRGQEVQPVFADDDDDRVDNDCDDDDDDDHDGDDDWLKIEMVQDGDNQDDYDGKGDGYDGDKNDENEGWGQ